MLLLMFTSETKLSCICDVKLYLLLSNSENREHLKYFGNVLLCYDNQNGDQNHR